MYNIAITELGSTQELFFTSVSFDIAADRLQHLCGKKALKDKCGHYYVSGDGEHFGNKPFKSGHMITCKIVEA